MPLVSVIIPTHDRRELLKRAIASVRAQTYTDWELIVVDDGSQQTAQDVVGSFSDSRIRCIRHEVSRGGGAARNTGIKAAQGEYIAFLDDDDEWLPEKLAIQMERFVRTGSDVGFCFSAVTNVRDTHEEVTSVADGVENHFVRALGNPKGYLTVTLVMKREVFDRVGLFDETLPSHQEVDLIIRAAKIFQGLGINTPLVRVNMQSSYSRTGGSIQRRIAGREMIIQKYAADFQRYPFELAYHYFQLGLWYRSLKKYSIARGYFWRAGTTHFSLRFFAHAVSMLGNGLLYRLTT